MSELVDRLRSEADLRSPSPLTLLCDDAADHIEELEAALLRLLDIDPDVATNTEIAFKMASVAHKILCRNTNTGEN